MPDCRRQSPDFRASRSFTQASLLKPTQKTQCWPATIAAALHQQLRRSCRIAPHATFLTADRVVGPSTAAIANLTEPARRTTNTRTCVCERCWIVEATPSALRWCKPTPIRGNDRQLGLSREFPARICKDCCQTSRTFPTRKSPET
uniref:(northern house mosquito) hypothetical protein n=1 Tax=Culex pipiens TaxID=7175 RepID=A0A8D8KR12_CULPI